jgi:hypothetical protein
VDTFALVVEILAALLTLCGVAFGLFALVDDRVF